MDTMPVALQKTKSGTPRSMSLERMAMPDLSPVVARNSNVMSVQYSYVTSVRVQHRPVLCCSHGDIPRPHVATERGG